MSSSSTPSSTWSHGWPRWPRGTQASCRRSPPRHCPTRRHRFRPRHPGGKSRHLVHTRVLLHDHLHIALCLILAIGQTDGTIFEGCVATFPLSPLNGGNVFLFSFFQRNKYNFIGRSAIRIFIVGRPLQVWRGGWDWMNWTPR